jgi:hypothetical protein
MPARKGQLRSGRKSDENEAGLAVPPSTTSERCENDASPQLAAELVLVRRVDLFHHKVMPGGKTALLYAFGSLGRAREYVTTSLSSW